MKSLCLSLALIVAALATTACSQPLPGGYAEAAASGKDVMEAAQFAVQAEQAMLAKDKPETKLELVSVTHVETQIVAGENFSLSLTVKLNGQEKKAHALVWWQAWRKPDPYRLTAWGWQ